MNTCGEIGLNIKTYYAGNNQVTHPNVLVFDEPWNSFRYWMVYTPYPYANGREENPSIAVSNDLINWEKPKDLINPIAWCEETECDELKDPHLVYRNDLNQIECWYLGRLHSTYLEKGPLYVFRKISKDGINWSDYEIVYRFNEFNLASPSINWTEQGYEFYGIRHDNECIGLYYMKSYDVKNWTKLIKCDVPLDSETDMWHGAIGNVDKKKYFIWTGLTGENRNKIFKSEMVNETAFINTEVIINNDTKWDYLYRPCFIYVDGTYYVYYGVIRKDGKWLISLSKGKSFDSLHGITRNEVKINNESEYISFNSNIKKHIIRKFVKSLMIPRLLITFPFLIIIGNVFSLNVICLWILSIIICLILCYKKFEIKDIKNLLLASLLMGTINNCFVSFFNDLIELFM